VKELLTRRRFVLRSIEGALAASLIPPAMLQMREPSPRLAIAGLGKRGTALLDDCIARSLPVAALCDSDPLAVRGSRSEFPEAALYSDFERLAASPEVDAIAIATPQAARLGEIALQRGKHVFFVSPGQPDLAAIERLTRAAAAHSLQIGVAPYDLSWDVDVLSQLLNLPPAAVGRTRFSLQGSLSDAGEEFGFDLLHHAVRSAEDSKLPSMVRAVRSGGLLRSWSASFSFEAGRFVELHAQALPTLKAGEMLLSLETETGKVILESSPEPYDKGAGRPRVSGFVAFLNSTRLQTAAHRSAVSVGVLHWSALLRKAF
jgi:hypothetical protein